MRLYKKLHLTWLAAVDWPIIHLTCTERTFREATYKYVAYKQMKYIRIKDRKSLRWLTAAKQRGGVYNFFLLAIFSEKWKKKFQTKFKDFLGLR